MKIYFIEYKNYIKFFGDNGNILNMPKNEFTYQIMQKIRSNKDIKLVDLL